MHANRWLVSPVSLDSIEHTGGSVASFRFARWFAWNARCTKYVHRSDARVSADTKEEDMGRAILLWLLGVPIPIIILLALFWH
jgi:hypothetical protein